MERSIIGTIATYTISDRDSRDAITDILEHLGYVDGKDQSTMICERAIPKTTIKRINSYCQESLHDFTTGDTISIYSPFTQTFSDGEKKPRIVKKDYHYDNKEDQFV